MDVLSKNALIDMVLTLIAPKLDRPFNASTDEEILRVVQPLAVSVAHLRKDKTPDLCGAIERWDLHKAECDRRQQSELQKQEPTP